MSAPSQPSNTHTAGPLVEPGVAWTGPEQLGLKEGDMMGGPTRTSNSSQTILQNHQETRVWLVTYSTQPFRDPQAHDGYNSGRGYTTEADVVGKAIEKRWLVQTFKFEHMKFSERMHEVWWSGDKNPHWCGRWRIKKPGHFEDRLIGTTDNLLRALNMPVNRTEMPKNDDKARGVIEGHEGEGLGGQLAVAPSGTQDQPPRSEPFDLIRDI